MPLSPPLAKASWSRLAGMRRLPTRSIDAGGTAQVTADCNKDGRTYYIVGSSARPRINLESHAGRWSPCEPGSRAQRFVDHLWPTDTFSVKGDHWNSIGITTGSAGP
jgi:hypothetical protein